MLLGVVWGFPNTSRSCKGALPLQVHSSKAGEMFVGMGGHASGKLVLSSSSEGQVLTASQSGETKAHRDEVTCSASQLIGRTAKN